MEKGKGFWMGPIGGIPGFVEPAHRKMRRCIWKYGGFPKIRGILLGVPTLRTRVFAGLYWGPPILGNPKP